MDVSTSVLLMCHCQVRPTVGRHHEEEDVGVKGISKVNESGSGVNEDPLFSLGFCPQADNAKTIVKPRVRASLNHMMFELRQIILMLSEQLIGHLANLSKG